MPPIPGAGMPPVPGTARLACALGGRAKLALAAEAR